MITMLYKILYVLSILVLIAAAGLFLIPRFSMGDVAVKIVQSGSMAPAIPVGALVVVRPSPTYAVGDVITFGEDTKTKVPTTHRIVVVNPSTSSGLTTYVVKGDANEEADPNPVSLSAVRGKVMLSIPRLGYLLDFAREPAGFILLIVVPAGALILDEALAIWREIMAMRRPGRRAAVSAQRSAQNIHEPYKTPNI